MMNIRVVKLFRLLPFILCLAVQSCKEHEIHDPVNEEELITTIQLRFTKWDELGQPAGEISNFSWRDVDAMGNPEIDAIVLDAHATYSMAVIIMDESKTPAKKKTPAKNITEEIQAESSEHQFFFPVEGAQISIQYNDSDNSGKPVGLENIVSIEHESTGSLTVILRHQPDKNATGVIDGDPTNASGETDIEAVFPITIIE
jgi:hypothetical protein